MHACMNAGQSLSSSQYEKKLLHKCEASSPLAGGCDQTRDQLIKIEREQRKKGSQEVALCSFCLSVCVCHFEAGWIYANYTRLCEKQRTIIVHQFLRRRHACIDRLKKTEQKRSCFGPAWLFGAAVVTQDKSQQQHKRRQLYTLRMSGRRTMYYSHTSELTSSQ